MSDRVTTRETSGVVVMGGGLAGLAAARTAARAGLPVIVLEKAGLLGGLARTVVGGDFRFDIGGHRWFTRKDEVNRLVLDLLGSDLLEVPRRSRIRYRGQYFKYPISLGDVVGRVEWLILARILAECILLGAHLLVGGGQKRSASMRDAFIAQFGRTLYQRFFEGYSQKVWGYGCEQMSGDWVHQRSRGLSPWTVARALLFKNASRVESLVERFRYPRLGIGQIADTMGRHVQSSGGNVLLRTRAREIAHSGGRVEAVRCENSGVEWEFGGSHFISSIPLNDLLVSLRPAAPAWVLEASSRLAYRDHVTVNLMLEGDRVTGDTWIYVHEPDIPFARVHEPANWSVHMAPAGKTSLVAEYFCSAGDRIWAASDDVLCEVTVNALADKLRLISRSNVLGAFVVRSPGAYPTYLLGYRRDLQVIQGYLAQFVNLQIIGRSGTFRYSNMDDSIEMGMLAARKVLGEAVVA